MDHFSSFHFLHKPKLVVPLELNWRSGQQRPCPDVDDRSISHVPIKRFSSVGCVRAHLGLALVSSADGDDDNCIGSVSSPASHGVVVSPEQCCPRSDLDWNVQKGAEIVDSSFSREKHRL